ncbi:C2H2-type zinc finger protein ASCRUDRAFT_17522, partial [Ascoidea rubescens DSM 1968]
PKLGATKVDQLMLIIKARKNGLKKTINRAPDGSILDNDVIPPPDQLVGGIDKLPKDNALIEKKRQNGSKIHQCQYCLKTFTQSTHLEVHVRSHIGFKPFKCQYCGKTFTQGGNLRTHSRLHTGERPFNCDVCGRDFSRKGNLAQHKLTHENIKPFKCELDNCGKSFTQLGNLKAHQNRFHSDTLSRLSKQLADQDFDIDLVPSNEKLLIEYFLTIYKNSNRGIKGRGKKTK